MAGWLHGVCVGACRFVSPLCGFSLSLFCNYICLYTPTTPSTSMPHAHAQFDHTQIWAVSPLYMWVCRGTACRGTVVVVPVMVPLSWYRFGLASQEPPCFWKLSSACIVGSWLRCFLAGAGLVLPSLSHNSSKI